MTFREVISTIFFLPDEEDASLFYLRFYDQHMHANLSHVDYFPTAEIYKFLTGTAYVSFFTLWDGMSCFLIMCIIYVYKMYIIVV